MPGATTTGVYVRALFRRPLRWGAAALLLVAVGCSCSPDELFREDARLRAAAVEALDGRPGAVIVLDVGTGRVRAIAGEDTAVRWPFHPGSLVKLVTVWKGMEEGTLDPGYRFTCRGAALFSGTEYHCWYPPGHGDLDMVRGIAYSCNLYFLSLGDRMSPVDTYRGLAELGFGKKTGVNLPGEVSGSLAGPADVTDRRYLIGDTDAVTATPLQVITYLSALVNGGSVWVPAVTGTPRGHGQNRHRGTARRPMGDARLVSRVCPRRIPPGRGPCLPLPGDGGAGRRADGRAGVSRLFR
jgi:cell division protein FtsI/penicillin-binding protein 2